MYSKYSEESCDKIPLFIVYWPSEVSPPVYCEEHAKKAKLLLGFMGTPVVVKEIND